MFECVEGLDEIEELQKCSNLQISIKATQLLTTYFELADEEEPQAQAQP